jgi:uncharacterized lipoprotein YmbA
MKNIFILIIVGVIFIACGSKQLYTLGDTSSIDIPQQKKIGREIIAVERIKLPSYLMDSPIYQKDTRYHLQRIEKANWIGSLDEHLTDVLITYLKKAQNNPDIYPYPWSDIKRIDKKISVTINTFIAENHIVTLEADYQIEDKRVDKISSYFFNTKEEFEGDSVEDMIGAMEKAFFKLTKDINDKL